MNVNTIIAGLHMMSEDDVRKINQAAYDILNGKRKRSIAAKKRELYVGMRVKFEEYTGHIVKINRTKCRVQVPGCLFNVPITMIEPAE